MSTTEFDRGYWFAVELKAFGKRLGLEGANRLRKDELEAAIKHYLKSGRFPARKESLSKPGARDTDRSLKLDQQIVAYVNNRETKEFLESEARRMSPAYRKRSGARYRLNRWRDEQLARGRRVTYRDLIVEYVRLSDPSVAYQRIPHGRYINFVSDYMAREKGATTRKAAVAWQELKRMNVPKTYAAWVKAGR